MEGAVAQWHAAEIWEGCGPKKDLAFGWWGEEEEQRRPRANYKEFRREAVMKIEKQFLQSSDGNCCGTTESRKVLCCFLPRWEKAQIWRHFCQCYIAQVLGLDGARFLFIASVETWYLCSYRLDSNYRNKMSISQSKTLAFHPGWFHMLIASRECGRCREASATLETRGVPIGVTNGQQNRLEFHAQ